MTLWSTSRERRPVKHQEEDPAKLVSSIFRSDGHFVQPSGTILAILVKRHKRNIYVKLNTVASSNRYETGEILVPAKYEAT